MNIENLPINIILKIYYYCDYKTLKNIRESSTLLSNYLIKYYLSEFIDKKIKYKKEKLIKNNFPINFINSFPEEVLIRCKKSTLSIDYIDSIDESYFKSSPYIYGSYSNSRFFFSVLLTCCINDYKYYKPITILQRYTDDENLYISLINLKIEDYYFIETFNVKSYDENFFKYFLKILKNKYIDNLEYIVLKNNIISSLKIRYTISD